MRRSSLAVVLVMTFGASMAFAQEGGTGAGRFEVTAMPGGGMFFTTADTEREPEFGNYVLGGAFAYNANRWIGFEVEGGSLVGVKQSLTFNGAPLTNQRTPFMVTYTGNVLVNPWGSDRPFIPFATAGLGGLSMFDTDSVANLDLSARTHYLTGNVGGGLKWFAARHWGVRGEYRLFMVDGKDTAPAFFGQENVRYAHRVAAGLVLTY
jgi:hypothetical protein